MTIPMPEPVAWMLAVQTMGGDRGWKLSWTQSGAGVCHRLSGDAHEKSLITTTQAEAYADARVAESQQWQPISTAPKDGTAVLVSNERGAWIAKYEPVYQSGYRPENPWFSLMLNHDHMRKGKPYSPTHWMPLPAPPSQPG